MGGGDVRNSPRDHEMLSLWGAIFRHGMYFTLSISPRDHESRCICSDNAVPISELRCMLTRSNMYLIEGEKESKHPNVFTHRKGLRIKSSKLFFKKSTYCLKSQNPFFLKRKKSVVAGAPYKFYRKVGPGQPAQHNS